MARSFVYASSQYLSRSGAPVSGYPATISAWAVTPTSHGGNRAIAGVGGSGASNLLLYFGDLGSTWAPYFFTRGATGGYGQSTSSAQADGTLLHLVGRISGASYRDCWKDGSSLGSSTATINALSSVTHGHIGAYYTSGAAADYGGGKIFEVAWWDVALSDAEITMLAKGVSPLLVRPESLVSYVPLWGRHDPEPDLLGGSWTLTNAPAYADHGRVFYPRRTGIVGFGSAAAPTTTPLYATARALSRGLVTESARRGIASSPRLLSRSLSTASARRAIAAAARAMDRSAATATARRGLSIAARLEARSSSTVSARRGLAASERALARIAADLGLASLATQLFAVHLGLARVVLGPVARRGLSAAPRSLSRAAALPVARRALAAIHLPRMAAATRVSRLALLAATSRTLSRSAAIVVVVGLALAAPCPRRWTVASKPRFTTPGKPRFTKGC